MNSIKKSDLALSFTKLSDPQSPLLRLLYSSLVSLIISMSHVFLPVFLSPLLAQVTFVPFVLSLPTDNLAESYITAGAVLFTIWF